MASEVYHEGSLRILLVFQYLDTDTYFVLLEMQVLSKDFEMFRVPTLAINFQVGFWLYK